MLRPTPYSILLEDLPVKVESYSVSLPHLTPLSTFADKVDAKVHVEGKWVHTEYQNEAEVTVTIDFSGSTWYDTHLDFSGYFKIKRDYAFTPAHAAFILGQHCYSLIEMYLEGKNVRDKDGKLYPMPKFRDFEDQWPSLYFRRP